MQQTAEALYETPFSETPEMQTERSLAVIDVDAIAGLDFARLRARNQAADILETNMERLRQGDSDSEVPIPVDALGTARRVVEARRQFGEGSPEYSEIYQGLVTDCHRLFGEAFRKNTWEYFSEAHQQYDPASGEFFAFGQSLIEIVKGGLSPMNEKEEQMRRTNEFVEETTYQAIARLSLQETVHVVTVSECPDWAIEAYARNSKGSYGGYVPEIQKLMLRNVRFDPVDGSRYEEQVGLSGEYITHEVVNRTLQITSVIAEDEQLDKIQIHAKQLVHDSEDGVFAFVELLDEVASDMSGKTIFMGEVVDDHMKRNYAGVREEAKER
ncbi:MAG: hypothetical protein JWL85_425, partial [Candidatus Saccharibacteria bacterium]|nr:hypothetical protein [Candidatus Saccharibacteria bacterium]